MTPHDWWQRRLGCVRVLLANTFARGLGDPARFEPRLAAALRDVLERPGSLVRALVAYLVAIEFGLVEESARSLACGLEYLHTASLVIDDLPAMDDAQVRRGAPALHVVHGEAHALLAALALVNRGYGLLWQGIGGAAAARRSAAGRLVDHHLGAAGLLGGQAHDLRGWQAHQDPAEVSEVAARKTASLLRLALVLPALAGHGTPREIQLLDRLALLRGLAYQAADDLKDVFAGEAATGKSGGRDAALGRPSLVAAEGTGRTLARLNRLRVVADRIQARLPGPPERWGMLALLRVAPPLPARMERTAG